MAQLIGSAKRDDWMGLVPLISLSSILQRSPAFPNCLQPVSLVILSSVHTPLLPAKRSLSSLGISKRANIREKSAVVHKCSTSMPSLSPRRNCHSQSVAVLDDAETHLGSGRQGGIATFVENNRLRIFLL
ncbi:hypothetical protein BDN71DRAFT_1507732 [Pleurotus eryngii]|uniref:Uncharacterized protein n=1 Tax=Pleurotus eryngii TaxID=5323 RepID=A0A9P5ZXU7_PLEER|nr:hypothetical protein BDN71DRAFT_1507732 [Pleurotus eryngii]